MADREGEHVDHFVGVHAQQVAAEQAAARGIGDHRHACVRLAEPALGEPLACVGPFDLDGVSQLLRLCDAHANGGERRIAETDAGHGAAVVLGVLAEDAGGDHLALFGGDRREREAFVGGVAGGPHTSVARAAEARVDAHAAAAGLDAGLLEAEAGDVGDAAGAVHNEVDRELAGLVDDDELAAAPDDLAHGRIGEDVDAEAAVALDQLAGEGRVEALQDPSGAMQDRDRRAGHA